MPRATTDAETMALKALLEPRKMQPNMMTRITVNHSAFNGTSRCVLTFAKNLEAGRPRSRAKAYTIRLLVVMMLTAANCRSNLLASRRIPTPSPGRHVNRCTYQQAHQRKHQQADGPCFIVGRIVEDLQHGPCGGTDDGVDIAGNEEQHAQVDEPGENTYQDTSDHNAGPVHHWVVQLFNTMSDCVKAG